MADYYGDPPDYTQCEDCGEWYEDRSMVRHSEVTYPRNADGTLGIKRTVSYHCQSCHEQSDPRL